MRKLLYLPLLISLLYFNSGCTKAKAQDELPLAMQIETALGSTSGNYIVVYAVKVSDLQSAVIKLLPKYKLTGGPFVFHRSGNETEWLGQAMYK